MRAEVISIAHSCGKMLLIIVMVDSFDDEVSLSKDLTTVHISIHDGNGEALILAEIALS